MRDWLQNRKQVGEVKKWIAIQTNNEQGTDYKEINLEGKIIKTLEFNIKPSETFWRAGFKLTDPNGSILPLRSIKSFLFHVSSQESQNEFGVTGYIDGEWDSSLNKTIEYGADNFIHIKFEVNEENYAKCTINNNYEYKSKKKIDPRILERVFLAAWGDGNPYRVEFDQIKYSLS